MSNTIEQSVLTPLRIWLLQDLEADPANAPDHDLARAGILRHALTTLARLLDAVVLADSELSLELIDLPGREMVHVGRLKKMTGEHWRGRAFVRDAEFGLELSSPNGEPDAAKTLLQGSLEWGGYRQEFLIRCENNSVQYAVSSEQ